jgi:hypothetical protein
MILILLMFIRLKLNESYMFLIKYFHNLDTINLDFYLNLFQFILNLLYMKQNSISLPLILVATLDIDILTYDSYHPI